MVVFLYSKIGLLYVCAMLTLISMKRHYGCAESCPIHDSGLLHRGVLQGIPEAYMLQLAYYLRIFLSVEMALRVMNTV